MEAISIVFIFIGALAVTVQLMKVIDWFEPTSPRYAGRKVHREAQ